MKVLYAILCEDARERRDARLDVHGIFHQLYAPGFPAQQDRITLAVTLEWEPHERGPIDIAIDLMDPSRSPVLSIKGQTEVGDQPGAQGPPQTRMLMPLERVVFPAEGTYVFVLQVGDERVPVSYLHLFRTTAAN